MFDCGHLSPAVGLKKWNSVFYLSVFQIQPVFILSWLNSGLSESYSSFVVSVIPAGRWHFDRLNSGPSDLIIWLHNISPSAPAPCWQTDMDYIHLCMFGGFTVASANMLGRCTVDVCSMFTQNYLFNYLIFVPVWSTVLTICIPSTGRDF